MLFVVNAMESALSWSSFTNAPPSVRQSLSFYQQNSEITRILDSMDVYVLPVMNPDGYKYTWTAVRTQNHFFNVKEVILNRCMIFPYFYFSD